MSYIMNKEVKVCEVYEVEFGTLKTNRSTPPGYNPMKTVTFQCHIPLEEGVYYELIHDSATYNVSVARITPSQIIGRNTVEAVIHLN